ncbi:hypothetical protein F511_47773 [Dorcoceras hygrometricum]|uniref:Uncharacterized protein n=1 Tax=Dorcoceras hygrometricum TaxID=472368 RepID=A0A2Z6ZQ56_9LAMI|nr:hypothetical protein F511_47773 [Dorcoceras hygrometricum]
MLRYGREVADLLRTRLERDIDEAPRLSWPRAPLWRARFLRWRPPAGRRSGDAPEMS